MSGTRENSRRGRPPKKINEEKTDKRRDQNSRDRKFQERVALNLDMIELCGGCKKTIEDGDEQEGGEDAILCDGPCGSWFHLGCDKITKREYTFLTATACNIQWYCETCSKRVQDMIVNARDIDLQDIIDKQSEMESRIEKIEKLEARIEKIEGLLDEQKEVTSRVEKTVTDSYAKVTTKCNAQEVQTMIEQQYKKATTEQPTTIRKARIVDPNENRERNIIIYNAPEGNGRFRQENQDQDKAIFKRIAEICEVEIPDGKIDRVIRLGKKTEGKRRPILVALSDVEDKKDIFRNLINLRNSDENIKELTLSNDMTPEERNETKQLLKEARELQDEDPEHWYRLRGPPWRREINKIRMNEEELAENRTLIEQARQMANENVGKVYRVRGPAGARKVVEIRIETQNE